MTHYCGQCPRHFGSTSMLINHLSLDHRDRCAFPSCVEPGVIELRGDLDPTVPISVCEAPAHLGYAAKLMLDGMGGATVRHRRIGLPRVFPTGPSSTQAATGEFRRRWGDR